MKKVQTRSFCLNICGWTSVFLATGLIMGCGGSSSGASAGINPDVKVQMRSISVSGFQSQVSASHYVLPMLAMSAPTGSSLSGLTTVSSLSLKRTTKAAIGYDSDLGLYYSTSTSGATLTANYYSDAAGTQSAGSIKATLENATSFNTNYTSYPQTIDLVANVTAGNIIANGSVKVSFSDASGTNTLVGTINAPLKGISAQLNMSLASSGAVGGTMTVVQNGLTSVVSNLTGDISSGFNGSVIVSPGNLQGTATINLLSESFTLHLSNGTTTADTTATPSTLSTTYNDGSSLTISSPISAPVSGAGTTSSGSTGSTSGGAGISNYNVAAVSGSPATINQVTLNGHMLGQIGTTYTNPFYYWDTPSSSPQAVTLDPTLSSCVVTGMNTKGNLVGYASDSSQLLYFLYWSSAAAQPVRIAIPNFTPIYYAGSQYLGGARASVLTDGRIILFGTDATINSSTLLPNSEQTWVFTSPTDTSPYRVAGFAVTSVSDNGSALAVPTNGTYTGGTYVLPQIGPNPASVVIPGTMTISSQQALLQNDGTVVINDVGYSTSWVSHGPTYTDQVFPNTTGLNISSSGGIQLTQVTSTGGLLGTRLQDNNAAAAGCTWTSPTTVPVNLGTYYPKFMTTSGAIIAYSNGYQVLTPKN